MQMLPCFFSENLVFCVIGQVGLFGLTTTCWAASLECTSLKEHPTPYTPLIVHSAHFTHLIEHPTPFTHLKVHPSSFSSLFKDYRS